MERHLDAPREEKLALEKLDHIQALTMPTFLTQAP
jgi:hypothetical protein